MEAISPPAPGEIIAGKYTLLGLIGHGGMGVVFEAEHLRMRQRVAIKFLKPHLMADQDALVRFEREARNASGLKSVHAARILDVDVAPTGIPYIVSELLEGHDLERELKARGALPVAQAISCVLQACIAMEEAHGLGIVHRDLKPSNLFLAKQGDTRIVKVLDFGISKIVRVDEVDLTTTGTMLGSPRYMAPEQVERAARVDGRADIWSLGVILFRALTAELPFEGSNAMELAVALVTKQPRSMVELDPGLPSALCAAVAKALAKNPAERFATMRELAQALEPFGSAAPLPSAPVDVDSSPSERFERPDRASRWDHSTVQRENVIPTPRASDPSDTRGSWAQRAAKAPPRSRARAVIVVVAGTLAVAAIILLSNRASVRATPPSAGYAPSSVAPGMPMPSVPPPEPAHEPDSGLAASVPSLAAPRRAPRRVPAPSKTSKKPLRPSPSPAPTGDQDPVFL